MDIIRGSLDGISRPASNSRINNGSKGLSSSLEILTREPDLPKVDFFSNSLGENSKENNDKNGEEYETQQMKISEQVSEEKINDFQLEVQHTNQVTEHYSSSADSEDDCFENQLSCSSIAQNTLAELQKVTFSSANQNDAKEKGIDPLLLKAIKKMKRLDQILANRQSKERAVKKQGRELRMKLWEEFKSMTSPGSSVIIEEVENTSRFLALTSPLPETLNFSACEENETFNIFETQLPPENYETNRKQTKQVTEGNLSDGRIRSSVKKMENIHPKSERSFVKKNIELAKDSSNQGVMLDEEKERLSELLKDTENESSKLQVVEDEATGMLVPGEGYTPEPIEYHHLAEINAKLKILVSDGDLPVVQSPRSKASRRLYQESLAYANRKLETIPGEKVLRDTKEERDQQNRLKEIDQQLKNLEGTKANQEGPLNYLGEIPSGNPRVPDVLPSLSEEQLNALLEECMQTAKGGNRLCLTDHQGNSPEKISPFDIFEDNMRDSGNELFDKVQLPTNQEVIRSEDKDMSSEGRVEVSYCNPCKTFVELPLSEKKGTQNQEDKEEAAYIANSLEDHFMSVVPSTERPKKPSFRDESFYWISINNELSTDDYIPSIPLKTRGGELKDEDVNED